MSKTKKQIELQNRINTAAMGIINYFNDVSDYAGLFRTMSEAQTTIMELTELNLAHTSRGGQHVTIRELYEFTFEANEIYKLLEPLADIANEMRDNKD